MALSDLCKAYTLVNGWYPVNLDVTTSAACTTASIWRTVNVVRRDAHRIKGFQYDSAGAGAEYSQTTNLKRPKKKQP